MKKIFLTLAGLIFTAFIGQAQNDNYSVMYSNEDEVTIFVNGGENSWYLEPETRPDIFRLYNVTQKVYDIKCVSDIDELSFQVKANEPAYFWVIYEGDSALTMIDFIDHIPNTWTDEQKLYALGLLWSETKYNFAFYDELPFDWDSLYQTYIPKVMATENDYDFYDQLELFVAALKDGHSQVSFSEKTTYSDYIPIRARYFGDDLLITGVRKDLSKLFPVGSKILEVNGFPLSEYMEQSVLPYINSSYEPTVRALAPGWLFWYKKIDHEISLTYQTPDQKILTNTPPRNANSQSGEMIGRQSSYPRNTIEIEWEKGGIAVLKFNTFMDFDGRLIKYFESIKEPLYKAKGIVIDLRQNGGGSTDVAEHLLQYIIKDSCFLSLASQTRINDGVKRANGNWIPEYEDFFKMQAYETIATDTIYIPDSVKRFDVPMVVLISANTVSAAEDFLIMLYEREDRPKFIGRPSFGSTGSPLVVWDWPSDDGFARICTRRVLFPYSMKPFTKGIMPDILIEPTFEEFMSEKDLDMEAAIEELNKQIKQKR